MTAVNQRTRKVEWLAQSLSGPSRGLPRRVFPLGSLIAWSVIRIHDTLQPVAEWTPPAKYRVITRGKPGEKHFITKPCCCVSGQRIV